MPVCINGLFKNFLHGIGNTSLTLVSMEFSSLEIRKDTLITYIHPIKLKQNMLQRQVNVNDGMN